MNMLILMLVLGAALLAWMLITLLRGVPQPAPPATFGRLAQVVPLPGLGFVCPERLFDPADFEAARASGASAKLANAVREERRQLALLWLRLLRDDLQTLWRFRRMMAAHGAGAGAAGELRLALSSMAAAVLIGLLRFAVTASGPYQAVAFCRAGRNRVETIWQACAGLFGRIPADRVNDFERAWAAAFPSTHAAFLR